MTVTIKLSTARELGAAGALHAAEILGCPGGYQAVLKVGSCGRALATKNGEPRLFASIDAAAKALRAVGLASNIGLDTRGYSPPVSARTRPDRSAALKDVHRKAAYAAWLTEKVQASMADHQPAVPAAEVEAHFAQKREALLKALKE